MRTHYLFRSRVRRLVAETIAEHRTTAAALADLRSLVEDESISAYGLRMLGAVEFEHGDPLAAHRCWTQAYAKREDQADIDACVEQVLAASALLHAGQPSEALAAFDAVVDDANVVSDNEQGRGDALSALGKLNEARAAYARALSFAGDDRSDRIALMLDLAYLELDLGATAAAMSMLDAAFAKDEVGELDGEARVVRARLLCAAGEHARALADLQRALELERDVAGLRERLLADDAFAALREVPEFVALVQEQRAAALWLDAHPRLAALREHAGLRERGVAFLDEDDAREGGDALREFYAEGLHLGTLWTPELWEACQQVAAPLWLLASGPEIHGSRHAGELKLAIVIYVDPSAPDTVWVGPHGEFPAALMTALPADGDAIAAALDQLFLRPPTCIDELPNTLRAFMGYPNQLVVPSPYSGELEQAGPHELDRHWNFSPALDPLVWGGAFADDPWPDVLPATPQVRMIILSRERRAQRRGTVARLTRRALFSRAHVGVEIHQSNSTPLYVWHIRYRSNPYPETIERFNAACGTDYPTDLPADVIAGLIGFDWMTAAQAEAKLAEIEPQMEPAYLNVIAAIRCDDWEVTQLLAERAGRPEIGPAGRGAIANLCLCYGWRTLLEQLAFAEPEPELRAQMLEALRWPMPETEFSEMGEPLGVYGGGPDDGDDDYDGDDDDDDFDDDDDDE